VQRDAPRDPTDTLSDDFDLISKLDLDLFTTKVDALNAHLDSVYGKDQARPEENRESDENARNRILINNRCRVVSDILLHLRCYRTLRDLEQKRTGQGIESFNSYVPPQPEQQANAVRVINTGRPTRSGVSWATGYLAVVIQDDDDNSSSMPDLEERAMHDYDSSDDDESMPGLQARAPNYDSSDDDSDDEDSMPPLVYRPHEDSSSDDGSDDEDSMPPLVYRPHEDSSSDDDSDDEDSSMPDLSRRQFYDSIDTPSPLEWQSSYPATRTSSSDNRAVAQVCSQVAYLATQLPDDIAMNTTLQPDETNSEQPYYSLLRDWLIDSGASSHMTNNAADLVLNIEESNAVVQVANGVLMRAESRGTVRARIQDLVDPHLSCDTHVHDVLHAPGLSRRLLSVDQWNAAGGETLFHPEHATLRAVDSDTGEAHSFSVAKPFTLLRNIDGLPSASSQQDTVNHHPRVQQEAHASSMQSVATVAKKHAMSSDLLHRRLGHRTVAAIMAGSRNDAWADTAMRWEHDNYCNSCQVVTARLANRGKSPLDVGHQEMKPGECVMVDIVPNLNKRGLTTSSHFKNFLLVADVKS
jgi:hypothetical protein